MERRILSDRQRRWLITELAEWRQHGIVSAEQAERMIACYETPADVGRRKQQRFTFAILGIAALLFGAAVLLLIGYNWEALPRLAKIGIIFGVIAATHGTGFYLRFVQGARWTSELVFLLGCLFYGAGIWLVAQVFHLDAHWPDGLWWWALGVLPFALCLESLLLHCLYAGLLAVWAGSEVFGFRHLEMWLFGVCPLPNGAYSLLLMALPGLLWGYRKGSVAALWLYVPLLTWWLVVLSFGWHLDHQTVFMIGTIGALLVIIAENHRAGSALAVPYRALGVLLTAGALVPMGYGDYLRHVTRYDYYWYYRGSGFSPATFALAVAIVMLLAVTVALSGLLKSRAAGETDSPGARLMALLQAQWLPAGLSIAMAFMALWTIICHGEDGAWVLPTIVANVCIVVFAIWLMRTGLRDDRGLPFAFGVGYFVLWAICRYCDLFGERGGMLGASLMFFLCGAMLVGLGVYWRRRKEVRHD
jgi:uncharacterized membrane protein